MYWSQFRGVGATGPDFERNETAPQLLFSETAGHVVDLANQNPNRFQVVGGGASGGGASGGGASGGAEATAAAPTEGAAARDEAAGRAAKELLEAVRVEAQKAQQERAAKERLKALEALKRADTASRAVPLIDWQVLPKRSYVIMTEFSIDPIKFEIKIHDF